MIHSFSCKNFYSFAEETTIDFTINKNAPESNGYFFAPSGNRLSKIETVIGANASGKTNLLKILPFLKWLIVESFNSKPENPILIQPFAFGEAKDKETELSVLFEIEKKVYNYKFILNKEKILHEELKLTEIATKRQSTKTIFFRHWNKKTNKYDFNGENFELPKEFEKLLRGNTSVIGTASRLNHLESQTIAKYWGQIETNVIETGLGHLPDIRLGETFHFFHTNNELKTTAENLLCRFDLGLSGFDITKTEGDSRSFSLNVRAEHLYNGKKEYLPIKYMSSGTKQLFILLKIILTALEKGSIVVIDEFELNLHPEMVIALYDLFIQPQRNPRNAQLLMSTHSHAILTKLDKYQIILVEKNENGISEAWRLDEMSNIRSDENYYSKYIAGAYGAIPKI